MQYTFENLLPDQYRTQAILPVDFESFEDAGANAKKIIGFDENHAQCFYYQSFTIRDEGFDIDEFPILIDVYFERVVAWRIDGGRWISVKSYSDKLDGCNKQLTTLPVELMGSMPR